MTMHAVDPCFCGQPATRTIGAVNYCHDCADKILKPIRTRVAKRHHTGFGEQCGRRRPDWGPNYADLACSACGATWVGPIGESCSWCADSLERMREWQAEMLVRPELPDPDDGRYMAAVEAWAQRLGRGVNAALVTIQQAIGAIQREERR